MQIHERDYQRRRWDLNRVIFAFNSWSLMFFLSCRASYSYCTNIDQMINLTGMSGISFQMTAYGVQHSRSAQKKLISMHLSAC